MKEIPRFCRYCGRILGENIVTKGFFTKRETEVCDCIDVLLDKEIDKKIEELEKSRPKAKYDLMASYSIEEMYR